MEEGMTVSAEQRKRLHKTLLVWLAVAVVGVGMLLLARNGIRIPCIFRKVTGLNCPGCGNTRAVVNLARGNILRGLSYNYLFPLEVFYLGWVFTVGSVQYIRTGQIGYRPPAPRIDVSILTAVVIWGVVRNIMGI